MYRWKNAQGGGRPMELGAPLDDAPGSQSQQQKKKGSKVSNKRGGSPT